HQAVVCGGVRPTVRQGNKGIAAGPSQAGADSAEQIACNAVLERACGCRGKVRDVRWQAADSDQHRCRMEGWNNKRKTDNRADEQLFGHVGTRLRLNVLAGRCMLRQICCALMTMCCESGVAHGTRGADGKRKVGVRKAERGLWKVECGTWKARAELPGS